VACSPTPVAFDGFQLKADGKGICFSSADSSLRRYPDRVLESTPTPGSAEVLVLI
jgi:hypothetical protein